MFFQRVFRYERRTMAAKKKTPARKPPKPTKKPSSKPSSKSAPKKGARAKAKAPAARRSTGKHAALKAKRRPSGRAKAPVTPKPKFKKAPVPENPEGLRLAQAMARVALDKKAEDVLILDLRAKGSRVGYDYLVLASGDSDRQLAAIADAIDDLLRPDGRRATSTEASADWVLVNYDDVMGHFFTPEKRSLYDLEGFWSDAPRVVVKA